MPSDGSVDYALAGALMRKDNASFNATARVSKNAFQTIRIQLTALGLVETQYSKTIKGDMALFWTLTELGRGRVFEWRTVKTAKQALAIPEN
jgi:hypothetical protein